LEFGLQVVDFLTRSAIGGPVDHCGLGQTDNLNPLVLVWGRGIGDFHYITRLPRFLEVRMNADMLLAASFI
jgi:hypothetical protein